jgi:hypothetical protein
MENVAQQFDVDDLIAHRLVAKAQADGRQPGGGAGPALAAEKPQLSKVEFVKVEKNLASLGSEPRTCGNLL